MIKGDDVYEAEVIRGCPQKAQGSLGVLMYSIVIITTEFYRMDFSL